MSASPAVLQENVRSAARRSKRRRDVASHAASGLALLSTLLVVSPLLAILGYLLYKGASSLNLAFFTKLPAPVGLPGGGMASISSTSACSGLRVSLA